jgi:hypothetical protein
MAQRKKANAEEVTDIKKVTGSKPQPDWWGFREDLKDLGAYPDAIEFEPDTDESLRKIRVRVTKAAKSLEMDIANSETVRGTLIVFRRPAEVTRKGSGSP